MFFVGFPTVQTAAFELRERRRTAKASSSSGASDGKPHLFYLAPQRMAMRFGPGQISYAEVRRRKAVVSLSLGAVPGVGGWEGRKPLFFRTGMQQQQRRQGWGARHGRGGVCAASSSRARAALLFGALRLVWVFQTHNLNRSLSLGGAFALVDRYETEGPAHGQK